MVSLTSVKDHEELDRPRRVMKYVLIWCSSGEIRMMTDDTEVVMSANSVLTITSGQVHWIREAIGAEGVILEFTLDYFCKCDADIELIFQNGLFCHFAMNEVIPVGNATLMNAQLHAISQELKDKPFQYLLSVHSRIEMLLIAINRAKLERGDDIWKPQALFLKFLELVREKFGHQHSVADFAEMLGTSEARLNEQAKRHTGKTAQNVIYGLTASEAKRLLTYEKLLVKEVAFKLGFSDPYYFSNFFKKHTRLSPKSYQAKFAI